LVNLSAIPVQVPIDEEIKENPPMCCVYGGCAPCCVTEECEVDPKLYPVVLIHGHSLLRETSPEPLLDIFDKIQYQLVDDHYLNAGTVLFDSTESQKMGEWGLSGFPITVKASYYYDYYYSLGSYIHITKSTDNIDTYAIRLNDIINIVKYKTGKPKVNIIAHSMGGLVARRYLQIFGEDSVDKLILIATPNEGIKGDVKKFCEIFGEKRECEDMYDDSILIKKLNDPNYKLNKVKAYTISGSGCDMNGEDGDGVVTLENSLLQGAKAYIIKGECTDTFKKELHTDLLNIDKYPEVYQIILQILRS
jgi:hypothetical protein